MNAGQGGWRAEGRGAGRQVQVELSCNAAHTQCDLMPCLLSNQAHGQRFLYAHNLTGFFLFYGFSNCFFNYATCGKREYGRGRVGRATFLSGLQSKHFLAIKFAANLHFHNNKNAFKTRQNFSNSHTHLPQASGNVVASAHKFSHAVCVLSFSLSLSLPGKFACIILA